MRTFLRGRNLKFKIGGGKDIEEYKLYLPVKPRLLLVFLPFEVEQFMDLPVLKHLISKLNTFLSHPSLLPVLIPINTRSDNISGQKPSTGKSTLLNTA